MDVPLKIYRHTKDYVLISIGPITHICRITKCVTVRTDTEPEQADQRVAEAIERITHD